MGGDSAAFRFSNEETRQILALIENTCVCGCGRMKTSTLKRFFRLPEFEEHLALHRMDCLREREPGALGVCSERFERCGGDGAAEPLITGGS